MILGEKTCHNFRENWLKAVPHILTASEESKVKNARTVLSRYNKKKLEEDIGIEFFYY